jgi:hypothetical protein
MLLVHRLARPDLIPDWLLKRSQFELSGDLGKAFSWSRALKVSNRVR